MTSEFYEDIKSRVLALSWVSEFHHFNNQFETATQDTIFHRSVFIEYVNPVPVVNLQATVRKHSIKQYDLTFRLHLWYFLNQEDDLDIYQYKDDLDRVMQGYLPVNNASNGAINLLSESFDQNHDLGFIYTLEYKCMIVSESRLNPALTTPVDLTGVELQIAFEIENKDLNLGKL